nr:MAG TPA: hypothetical protein [Caudoviricetes sp.]
MLIEVGQFILVRFIFLKQTKKSNRFICFMCSDAIGDIFCINNEFRLVYRVPLRIGSIITKIFIKRSFCSLSSDVFPYF